MYVVKTRCTGCGVCEQACPSNAIRLVDDKAQIDPELCRDCRTCVEVCPSEAIIVALPVVVPSSPPMLATAPAEIKDTMLANSLETNLLSKHSHVIAPAIGSALLFLGRKVVPRVVLAVADTILQHTESQTNTQPTSVVRKNDQRRLRRRTRGNGR